MGDDFGIAGGRAAFAQLDELGVDVKDVAAVAAAGVSRVDDSAIAVISVPVVETTSARSGPTSGRPAA